ncbi:MAG: transcription antitermination factor NusB [Pseudomonadota bacterium]
MSRSNSANSRRSHTRALLMQAHYQQQLDGTSRAGLLAQFRERREHERVDPEYFEQLLKESMSDVEQLDAEIAMLADRDYEQLNPVEIAVLRVSLTELKQHIEIPFRVVINEGVELARRFGAEDGHKYVNAILDRSARTHRSAETAARDRGAN